MMEKFEEKKFLSYLSACLHNKNFLCEKIPDLEDWLENDGQRWVNFRFWSEKEEEKYGNFKKFYYRHKRESIRRGQNLAAQLQQKISAIGSCKISRIEKKLQALQKILGLDETEKEILGFYLRDKVLSELDNLNDQILNYNARRQDLLPYVLPFAETAIILRLGADKPLQYCGMLKAESDGNLRLSSLAQRLFAQRLADAEDIKKQIIGAPVVSRLSMEDFNYVEDAAMFRRIVKKASSGRTKGVNLLFYGAPGTGKTEFAKTVCAAAGANLYAIGEDKSDGDDERRLSLLAFAQRLLQNERRTVFLVDEADDILLGWRSDKLNVNRALENNHVPCIYIVNSIDGLDKAYLRRFTCVAEFARPSVQVRAGIWQKKFREHKLQVDAGTAEEYAQNYTLAPSFIENAVKCAKLAGGGLETVRKNLAAFEKAGNPDMRPPKKSEKKQPAREFYPELLNTDVDLHQLAENIKKLPERRFSLCLYGISGTGKSAYAEYLARCLNMPVVKKRCSDLLSMWVGGTEKNIAAAFSEAGDKKALLIFDEADSLLQDRSRAVRSWEVTQVNEMLTQMESHPYPFVCTTNLMDSLDKASLRRFTFKVEYDYMTVAQARRAFKLFFAQDMPENITDEDLSRLTPGDFTLVQQKAAILGAATSPDELMKMLLLEQKNKLPPARSIGFI